MANIKFLRKWQCPCSEDLLLHPLNSSEKSTFKYCVLNWCTSANKQLHAVQLYQVHLFTYLYFWILRKRSIPCTNELCYKCLNIHPCQFLKRRHFRYWSYPAGYFSASIFTQTCFSTHACNYAWEGINCYPVHNYQSFILNSQDKQILYICDIFFVISWAQISVLQVSVLVKLAMISYNSDPRDFRRVEFKKISIEL